ncbi:MAG TPA: NAD(P)-dependent oxidoreductase [Rubrobacteraceae bacterium]|nr:NAD(P)-dependent oxidoreductase [Rubrobacteraceae bacterium]
MKLGFLGLGAMGLPMAKNLIEVGHDLAVWNRTSGRDEALVEAGARRTQSPADAARDVRAIVLMLADAEAVREVLFGEGGVVEGLPEGATVVDMSTIGAADSVANARALDELGYNMLDTPVSGSVPGAEAGTLAIMVGGKEDVLEECRPVLEAMGDRIFYLGPSGSGTRMKLVLNLVAAANLAILAEGLALGEAAEIPAETVVEVLMAGAAASKMCEIKGPKIAAGLHDPQFKLLHMVKDLYYALALGREAEKGLPITGLVSQIYTAALREHGEKDISAVSVVGKRRT